MTKVTFISADGEQRQEVDAPAGSSLLSVAQAAGQPLEGTCEGQMACSTCHVYVDEAWVEKLPKPESMEEDMLDFAYDVRPTSRLSCQIRVTAEIDGLVLHTPEQQG